MWYAARGCVNARSARTAEGTAKARAAVVPASASPPATLHAGWSTTEKVERAEIWETRVPYASEQLLDARK